MHTLLEVLACLLAVGVGTGALIRYRRAPSDLWLLLGIGFLSTGLLDAYHTLLTAKRFAPLFPSTLEILAPWSWLASRLFSGVLFVFTWFALRRQRRGMPVDSPSTMYFLVGVGLTAALALFSSVSLPAVHYPDFPLHRPAELLAAIAFGVALVGFLRLGDWKTRKAHWWIVASLAVSFIGQVGFMAFSIAPFDLPFDLAHGLKLIAYAFIGAAVLTSRTAEPQASSQPLTARQVISFLELRAALAFLVIAFSITAAFAIQRPALVSDDTADVVNRAGRQRLLVAQISTETQRHQSSAGDQAREAAHNVGSLTGELVTLHLQLYQQHTGTARSPTEQHIRDLYDEPPYFTHQRIVAFISEARRSVGLDHATQHRLPERKDEGIPQLLRDLDLLVEAYVDDQNHQVAAMSSLSLALYVFTVLALILTGIFVLVPLVRQAGSALKSLEAFNSELEARVEERATEAERGRRRAEKAHAELIRRNRELDDFTYIASHDLKSPLRDVHNLSDWLREDLADKLPERSQHHLELVGKRVARMEALLDDLLDYSRAGKKESAPEMVRIGELVQEAASLLSVPTGFSIRCTGSSAEVTLNTSRTALAQVLRNLIDNAIKHHDRNDGSIVVVAHPMPNGAEIFVRDDGPGISEEHHERIFRMFQRLRPDHSVEGSGIGLAVVRKLVEHYGGKIGVEANIERGTTFVFTWQADQPSL